LGIDVHQVLGSPRLMAYPDEALLARMGGHQGGVADDSLAISLNSAADVLAFL
jgi:hypothetical protein